MIQEIVIGGIDRYDDQYYEPPTELVSLAVIGGIAHLEIHLLNEKTGEPELSEKIQVPARSLLRALQVAIEDDRADPKSEWKMPTGETARRNRPHITSDGLQPAPGPAASADGAADLGESGRAPGVVPCST